MEAKPPPKRKAGGQRVIHKEILMRSLSYEITVFIITQTDLFLRFTKMLHSNKAVVAIEPFSLNF